MAEVVNFNKARKAKVRDADRARATENRVKFGRTGTQKAQARAEAEKAARDLDGAKRET